MAHWRRKRKHQARFPHPSKTTTTLFSDQNEGHGPPDPALFIEAHEADVIRGPQAGDAARSLEFECISGEGSDRKVYIGDGLIKWERHQEMAYVIEQGEDTLHLHSSAVRDLTASAQGDDKDTIWVDRYDARLLLDTLPSFEAPKVVPAPSSPTGWSDLPSDSEDTFFFSASEVDDYRRAKKRRTIDADRNARLQALHRENEEDGVEQEEQWGGSDEEPDDTQKQLMERTAKHLLSSPNPAQLEMRILANHGADRRFAFLKGRWSRTWKLTKGRARLDLEEEKDKKSAAPSALGSLAGYGGSDSEDSSQNPEFPDDEDRRGNELPEQVQEPSATRDEADQESIKQARRARAREWAEKRKAARSLGDSPGT